MLYPAALGAVDAHAAAPALEIDNKGRMEGKLRDFIVHTGIIGQHDAHLAALDRARQGSGDVAEPARLDKRRAFRRYKQNLCHSEPSPWMIS